MKFRKKPIVIEAMKFDGSHDSALLIVKWSDAKATVWGNEKSVKLTVFTNEGAMAVAPNDWVIRGIKGEFYPCKPDIFEATYEPA